MEQYIFKNLLDQVNALNAHYIKISELTGENFNLFRILKLESSEVRLHSAFLAELLNPKGNHGQKDAFLKLFVDRVQFRNNDFHTPSATVEIEKHTGFINDVGSEGGRIDIILTDRYHKQIIIENKIYAGDQKNQLVRYNHYSLTADLLYLTLEGKSPNRESYGTLIEGKDFKCISYSKHIKDWLEQCRKEVAIYPIIRETITQYLNLIKYLTNQTMNDMMNQELATLITSNYANVEAAFTIIHSLKGIKQQLLDKFNAELNSLAEELGLKLSFEVDFNRQYSGIYFYREGWEDASIGFGFQSYSNALLYGIIVEQPEQFSSELRETLVKIKPSDTKTSDWWPIFRTFEAPYNNWNDSKEVWTAVFDGSMVTQFKHKLNELVSLLDFNNITL
ncbi:MAG: PD-(D/E)XK nuclease family protein [Mucilaginibacter sp.]|uniref:PDDEXK-like family protein n=1 Tax=Mucilaginibacter sp. TaxID=1882438 RepID=UPI0031B460A5